MMNMNPTQCNELSAEHDERTKWHNDDLRDAQRLDEAWAWLCESRKTAPANADIWHLRQRWPACLPGSVSQKTAVGRAPPVPHVGGGDTPSGDVARGGCAGP